MRILIRRILIACLLVGVCVLIAAASPKQPDAEGFKDPALFTRMPNYWGHDFSEREFDAHQFPVGPNKKQSVEGHYLEYGYGYDQSLGPKASDLQIIRNYENAAKRIGGKVVYENIGEGEATVVVTKDGRETWAEVSTDVGNYRLYIVERQAMKQDVVADAAALQGGLAREGHVEVPGIFFDFNKSDVKPESKPALDEVAKLLKASPAIKVWVVGHTDSVGTLEANMKLSEARAAAVAKALVTEYGISAARLKGIGAGPIAPVASNKTEEGRAKNRRVELVEM